MGRLRTKSEYEDLRKARILGNNVPLETLGLQKSIPELRSLAAKPKLERRKWRKIDCSSTPVRRSNRLKGKPCDYAPSVTVENGGFTRRHSHGDLAHRCPGKDSDSVLDPVNVEMEKARLESLGLQKAISELRSIISSKPKSQKRKLIKIDFSSSPLRRSSRLEGKSCDYRPSVEVEDELMKKAKNGFTYQRSPDALSRRCSSKARGSVYDPVYGICCHFCRQKKLCGEEDCKHCGELDMDQLCIGKTDCSICHSSNGVLCRACLKVRYGEEMEEVRANKEWICPHCTEEKGINPYWICNSSLCLKKRKMVPTGIAIYRGLSMAITITTSSALHIPNVCLLIFYFAFVVRLVKIAREMGFKYEEPTAADGLTVRVAVASRRGARSRLPDCRGWIDSATAVAGGGGGLTVRGRWPVVDRCRRWPVALRLAVAGGGWRLALRLARDRGAVGGGWRLALRLARDRGATGGGWRLAAGVGALRLARMRETENIGLSWRTRYLQQQKVVGASSEAERKRIEGLKLTDLKAKNYLFQALDRSVLEMILKKDTAKNIWDSMKQKFQGATRVKNSHLQALRKEFEILEMKIGESVNEYFARTLSIVNKMSANGETTKSDADVVSKILRSMTSKFNYVLCSIEESKDTRKLTIDELQSSLLVHEQRMNMNSLAEEAHALKISISDQSNARGRGRGSYRGRGRGRER
nr:cell division cycle-associated protein 7-like [Ipomoea batatas]